MEAVVGLDEGGEGRLQLGDRLEVAAPQASALEGVEPELDLVQPAGVEGQEVEGHAVVVTSLPLLDVGTAVDVEVVENKVDDLAVGDLGVQLGEEGDELLPTTAGIDLAEDAAGVDFERGEQAAGAVADVLERALGEFTRTP